MPVVVVIDLALKLVARTLLAKPGLLGRVAVVHGSIVHLGGHLDVLIPCHHDDKVLPLSQAEAIGSSITVCRKMSMQ